MIEKFYDINKIIVVIFRVPYLYDEVDGCYDDVCLIRQLFYYPSKGTFIDIFKDDYIASLYDDNAFNFNFNPVNFIDSKFFTNKEREAGRVSYERLLEVYCMLNKGIITYENVKKSKENKSIVDFGKYILKKRKPKKKEGLQ